MAKETYFFPHDFTSTSDPKIEAMISQYGVAGYGLYWIIVEMMHCDSSHSLPYKPYVLSAISKKINSTSDFIIQFLEDCCTVFELFKRENDSIICERVLRNFEYRKEKSNTAKANAAKRWDAVALQKNATAMQNDAKKGKERKGKEIKEVNTIVFTEEQKEHFSSFQNWVSVNAPRVSEMKEPITISEYFRLTEVFDLTLIRHTLENMHNWKNLTTKISANKTLRNWANKDLQKNPTPATKKQVVI